MKTFLYYSIIIRMKSMTNKIFAISGSDNEESFKDPIRTNRAESTISQSILGTPASVIEDDNNNDEDYEKQADDVIEKIWRIFRDEESWSQETKSSNGLDVVISKTFPKVGKVFRLSV